MDETLGCSKCRYSQRGCARCRDPAFRHRQPAVAQGRKKLPGKVPLRGRKRPAETSGVEKLPERPPGSKRTRFTRKARKGHGHSRSAQACTAEQETTLGSQGDQEAPRESVRSLSHAEDEQPSQANAQEADEPALDAAEHVKPDAEAKDLQESAQETATEGDAAAAAVPGKQVASGLELGLMAGLLPLQQGSQSAEPARSALEEATLISKEPAGVSCTHGDSKSVSGGEGVAAMQSTSQQSRDVSQTSTGMPSNPAGLSKMTPKVAELLLCP